MVLVIVMKLIYMTADSGLERGAAGMQRTNEELPTGTSAQREERIQGQTAGFIFQSSNSVPDWWLQKQILDYKISQCLLNFISLNFNSSIQTNGDFVEAATRGAVAVVDGNVMPLNPGESPRMQMFIWNNIFFSQGFDISEHYQPLGGDSAAHAAAICDLRGAQVENLREMPVRVVKCLEFF